MKKIHLLLIAVLSLLINGCTIVYNTNNQEDDNQSDSTTPEQTPYESIEIDPSALFYPNSLSLDSDIIKTYTYIDSNLASSYKIHSAYYSETYDTIYIAYDYKYESEQNLRAKDLYEIEKHAVNYFISDEQRSEDKNYLKAVRIYPDRLASSCRRGLNDASANTINGCADYGGQEAIIDLNNIKSLDDFYNSKTKENYYYEPMRDTFAHEYGHISTFYHMVYKNDENYEDYLKIRLGSYYNTIYPDGLPSNYSSGLSYSIQPEEILADDFVELFYDTSVKKENDSYYEYELAYNDLRNSLESYIFIKKLKPNQQTYEALKNYYSKFIDYSNKVNYDKPIVVSNENNIINYYESYSHIQDSSKLKTITSLIDVNLIAIGEVTVNNIKYYRVVLSNTYSCPSNNGSHLCDKKDVGEKIGYVDATDYTINNSIDIYIIDQNNGSKLSKNDIVPIKDNNNMWYILPYYETSYAININNNTPAIMYDYLNEDLSSTQTYEFGLMQFGTLIE